MQTYTKSSRGFAVKNEDRWMNQTKWGLRLYRTTYESDEQWSEFMSRFKAAIVIYKPWRENDLSPDYYKGVIDEELMVSLDFDVVDNKAKFDRATRPQLIADFKTWVAR